MTTPSERKFLHGLYFYLEKRLRLANKSYGEALHAPLALGFGVYDDQEERKVTLEREITLQRAQHEKRVLEDIWGFVTSQYPKWDLELAIQENEGRIGDLPYAS